MKDVRCFIYENKHTNHDDLDYLSHSHPFRMRRVAKIPVISARCLTVRCHRKFAWVTGKTQTFSLNGVTVAKC